MTKQHKVNLAKRLGWFGAFVFFGCSRGQPSFIEVLQPCLASLCFPKDTLRDYTQSLTEKTDDTTARAD